MHQSGDVMLADETRRLHGKQKKRRLRRKRHGRQAQGAIHGDLLVQRSYTCTCKTTVIIAEWLPSIIIYFLIMPNEGGNN